MTINDLLKRVSPKDYDKCLVLTDGIGWTNLNFAYATYNTSESLGEIALMVDKNEVFSDDKC